MKKFAILAIVVTVLFASSALVWGGYIFEDPIFAIGENQVNVLIGKDVPAGETVSQMTRVIMFVPRNVPARLIDPLGCQASLRRIGAQYGPLRISLAAVKAPKTDQGSTYTTQVTVFDDDGFSLTLPGRAGRWTVVPYFQWN